MTYPHRKSFLIRKIKHTHAPALSLSLAHLYFPCNAIRLLGTVCADFGFLYFAQTVLIFLFSSASSEEQQRKKSARSLWSLKFSGAQRTRHNHFATAVWLLLLLVLLLLLLVVVLQIISLFANTRARTTLAAHKFMCTQNDERDTKSKWEKNNRATEMERANAKNDRAENTLWHVLRTLLFRIVCECVCANASFFLW